MREDVKLNGWSISAESMSSTDAFLESVFFTGNGRMGARGYSAFRTEPRPVDVGFFVAGVFDEIKPGAGITDFVNLPTPLWETVEIDGVRSALQAPIRRELDLRTGTLTIRYRLTLRGKGLEVTEQRFFPLNRPDLLVQRLELTTDSAAVISVSSGIDNRCCNSPVPDDQVKQNHEEVQLTRYLGRTDGNDGLTARYATARTGIQLCQSIRYHTAMCGPDFYEGTDGVGAAFRADMNAGETVSLEKLTHLSTSRDADPRLGPVPVDWDYEDLQEENRRAWAAKWETCDLLLEGDDALQTALRYNIYQLIVNCSSRDDTVSIGARGLTHTRYKGCYFWDTDLFMMPFYLLTDPPAARSLMGYRVNTLPQARAHATKMGGAGARYPWMASYDGTEQCESWDIGCSEVHVTADVAYAAGQYLDWTGDRDFFLRGGGALLVETARFWVSRYSPEPGTGKVNLLFCKGPDEYCGITSNNLFTNMMVRHNLKLAARAANFLLEENLEQYEQLGLSPEELDGWNTLHDAIQLPQAPDTGHWRTDDTFHLLERVDPRALKDGDEASYHNVCFDRLQRYQVVKQADVLLLMTRLGEHFTEQERLDAWSDFEPLCLHDSTLSFASHALFAAQNGLTAAAESYFQKAAFLDLKEVMGNTGKEGLHLACLGETWQTVVFGFAGLHLMDGIPSLNPQLPPKWQRLCFSFQHRGKTYKVDITADASIIECLGYPR